MMRRLLLATCILAVVLIFIPKFSQGETRVVDATGRRVTIPDNRRIVSVGGAVTEIIYALGLANRIVAVDTTSRYPAEAASKPNVGYMRRLSAEPILALESSVVLAVADSGPPAVLDQLREAGLPVVLIPDDPSPAGVLEKIAHVAAALGVREKGATLAARLKMNLDAVSAVVVDLEVRPRVLFLLSIGRGGAPLAAGRKTAAAAIIELAGGVNAVDAFEGYKPLSPEAAIAAAPDVILVNNRSLRLLGGREGLLGIPEIKLTPAGQNRRIVAMDGLLLLGFGPRISVAIAQLVRQLHAGINLPAAIQ